MPTPLFSTYRQGENRVSGSLLAVFERLGIDLVARIVGAALEEPELVLVTYTPQLGRGGHGVPDGEMRADFRYLFEVKTDAGQVTGPDGRDQIKRHLDRLTGDHRDERLIVLTPDAGPPPLLAELDDDRIVWTSFEALSQAVADLLADPAEPASEQQRLLLRELVTLFELDGLVAGEDVAVVAASAAYDLWRRYSAYVCQPNRSFRPVTHWGFYRSKRIEPEFPRVLAHYADVIFDQQTAADRQASGDPRVVAAGQVIKSMLADGIQEDGVRADIRVLEPYDSLELARRATQLPHLTAGAWTQGLRYARLDRLINASRTEQLEG